MKTTYLNNIFKTLICETRKEDDITVSYSQFSMYAKCPLRWRLNYADGLKANKGTIETVFGTSMHETLQWYLQVLYTESAKKANSLDLNECLLEQLKNNYMLEVEKHGKHFSTKAELAEFYEDGVEILNFIKKKQPDYFSSKNEQLVAIELPILTEIQKNVKLYGFIDVVIYNKKTNRFRIIDIKTSRQGWNDNAKKDKTKAAQILFYKEYFAKQYGFSAESIDVEFYIVKRKIFENVDFPQKRVQLHKPASGKPSLKAAILALQQFIDECFNDDGSYKMDREYLPIAGQAAKNCTYCEFKLDFERCPKDKRIKK